MHEEYLVSARSAMAAPRNPKRVILRSIAKEDFRDLMRPDARAGNARMTTWFRRGCDGSAIGQDTDRSPGIEKTDNVVAVGEEAAPCATRRRPAPPRARSCSRSAALK